MSESAPLNNDTPVVTPVVPTPAPKKSNLLRNILIGATVLILGTYAYLHVNHAHVIVSSKGVSITFIKKAPVVQAPVKVAPPAVVAPVKATPPVAVAPAVQAPTVTPAPVAPVHVAPSHPTTVVPYLNHGNFVHGNSNPAWPR